MRTSMRRLRELDVDVRRGGDLAYVVVVVSTFVSMIAAAPGPPFRLGEIALLAIGCGLYIAIGLYGWALCRPGHWPVLIGPYFGVQIALAVLLGGLGRYSGGFWLLMYPLAGQSVLLPRRWTLVVCGVVLASITGQMWVATGSASLAAQSSVSYLAGLVFVVVLMELLLREERARADVERLAAELRAYASQAEELATARERNRLAREIHDTLGHYLTAINVQIEAARTVLDADRPRALDALDKTQMLVRDGLSEVRRSVAALRAPPIESRPLPEAVARLVEEARAAGIATELEVAGTPRPLAPQATLTLYRAAQEALTNVRRHARASRADVLLEYAERAVHLVIRDDGVGNAVPNAARTGFGLLGVRERAELLGGSVSVRTAPGQGFALEVTVPA
jgi:signal transduction histidine kinase